MVLSPHLDRNCVELRGLHLGLRQAWRLRVLPPHVRRFRDAVDAMGYELAISRQRFADIAGGHLQAADDGGHLVVVASQAAIASECLRLEIENTARLGNKMAAQLDETLSTHRLLGATYGYPDCCVDAFCDAHAQSVIASGGLSDNAWIIYRAAQRSRTFHPLLRAFGSTQYEQTASPLRHLPCRFDCDASIEIAGALIRDLERSNPELWTSYRNAPVADLVVNADGSVAVCEKTVPAARSNLRIKPVFPVRLPFRSQRYAPDSN